MMLITFYVPKTHVENVKNSMFMAGAGKIGAYDSCSFEVDGIGQFRPLDGSSPFLGSMDQLEKVHEVKVEMVCEDHLIKLVVEALKGAHPYEMPAYHVIKTLDY